MMIDDERKERMSIIAEAIIVNQHTVPSYRFVRLETTSRNVDFPAPDGPITASHKFVSYTNSNAGFRHTCKKFAGMYFSRYPIQDFLSFDAKTDILPS
jgi:hypothetical protein